MNDAAQRTRDLRPFLRLGPALHRWLGARLREVGERELGPSHGQILGSLHRRGDLTPSELAAITGRDISTITALVGKLAGLGYVSRVPNPGDGRSKLVRLTPAGRVHHAAVVTITEDFADTLTRDIPAADWETCLRVLETLRARLDHP